MILSDTFDLIDTYNYDINWILEESECCLHRRSEIIGYQNPICKLIKVRKLKKETIYTFQIYEDEYND